MTELLPGLGGKEGRACASVSAYQTVVDRPHLGLPLSRGMASTQLREELRNKLDMGEGKLTEVRLPQKEIAGGE
jgi:hypothetical protein